MKHLTLFAVVAAFGTVAEQQALSATETAFRQNSAVPRGIRVTFMPISSMAHLDSVTTDATERYECELTGGSFKVMFTFSGFLDTYHDDGADFALAPSNILDSSHSNPAFLNMLVVW